MTRGTTIVPSAVTSNIGAIMPPSESFFFLFILFRIAASGFATCSPSSSVMIQ